MDPWEALVMKEPMEEKEPHSQPFKKLNMDLMRQHRACNYRSNPSGEQQERNQSCYNPERSAQRGLQRVQKGKVDIQMIVSFVTVEKRSSGRFE